MERGEARQATRKTIVEDIKVHRVQRGDPFFPKGIFTEDDAPNEIWQIFVTTREGLQPTKSNILYFSSDEAATTFQKDHPIGSEFGDLTGDKELDCQLFRAYLKPGVPFGVCAGDEESPLAFEVLRSAGIYRDGFGPISQEVVRFIGVERIAEIKESFGDNWETVAAFEYCWMNLPHSSPAFAAASYQYHHYITGDDFSAGYHWRDLEIMVHKVEVQALKIIETRARAGQSGSRKSAQARGKRRAALFAMIETLSLRNPDMVKFLSADAAAKLAVEECSKENPGIWRQGKGQANEYLDEIRRGEAGPDLQKRYREIFGDKPPKRFRGSGQRA